MNTKIAKAIKACADKAAGDPGINNKAINPIEIKHAI